MLCLQTFRQAVSITVMCGPAVTAVAQEPPRAYRIDDYFESEDVRDGSVTFSPDGQAMAFTRIRPASSQITNGLLIAETRSEVWLQDGHGRPVRNLTNGQADSSGWWAPAWAPDNNRIAMLSSRGDNVTLWAWERATNQVRQLSKEGVDFGENGGCRWVDARRVLCLVLPEGERSSPLGTGGYAVGKGVELAETAWAKAKRGERTVSAINSLEFRLPERRLVLVDVTTASGQTIATTQVDGYGGASHWLSPDAAAAAYIRPRPAGFSAAYRARMGHPASIDIRFLDDRKLSLDRPLPSNVVTSTIQWSPDGTELAFFALEDQLIHPELLYGEAAREVVYPAVASKEYPGRLWRVDLERGRVQQLSTGDIDLGQGSTPPDFMWTAAGDLLFHSARLTNGARPVTSAAPEWLVLGRDGQTRALVKDTKTVPNELESIDGGAGFVGLADGEVWRIDPVKGTRESLTATFAAPVLQFSAFEDDKGPTVLVVSAGEPRTDRDSLWLRFGLPLSFAEHYVLEPGGGSARLPKPGPQATLVSFAPRSNSAVFYRADRTGSFLWRGGLGGAVEELVAANTFWHRIAAPEQRIIEYTTLNGERMKAMLTLPVGYEPGQHVPLVVDSDIGLTAANAPHVFQLSSSSPPGLPEEIFAAAGYAYMFTSWPVTSMDSAGRANLLLGPNGIIPAVDEVIRAGIADPERLFLYGGSSMGYGVYGLVTQTSRFKAAVAGVGWVDQISSPLGVDPVMRYSDNPFDLAAMGSHYSVFRLPVWRNAEHLRRNSPLSYVDRVQTPLMIIGGDMDGTSNGLTQDELFFSALVQQRKPAEFVRYWGTGHGNYSGTPANLRDEFQRVFSWFDRWGDISRDANGTIVYENDHVKTRGDEPALQPEDYATFSLFGSGGHRASAAPVP